MALLLNFKISQPNDCKSAVFTDTTGDYDAISNPGGYGAPNIERTDVKGTLLTLTDSASNVYVLQKSYLPTTASTTTSILDSDLGLETIPTACYDLNYEIFTGDISSGNIVQNQRYMVVNPGTPGDTLTYNGTVYNEGEVFVGVSGVTTYAESGSVEVAELTNNLEQKFLYYCKLRQCIKNLYLKNGADKSIKGVYQQDFINSLVELDVDMNSAIIAFEEAMFDCACDSIGNIEKACIEFMSKCCE